MNPTTGGDTFLLITIIGFGIQQFVQVVIDPIYTLGVGGIRGWKASRRTGAGDAALDSNAPAPAPGLPTFSVPGQISDVDSKKLVLGLITIALAWLVVENGPGSMRLLQAFKIPVASTQTWLDSILTVLVIAAGTEGANSILKLLQYAKQAVKERTQENPANQPRNTR